MEKKITMNHNDKKIEYILYDTPPCRPFLNINGFYLRLSQIPSGDIKINGLYPYMQRNSIYVTNEDGFLKKITSKEGVEEWNCNVGKNINSVFTKYTNVFVANRENIRELDDNTQLLRTLNIQSDKVIADGGYFYTTNGNRLSKVSQLGQEQVSYDLDSNIKDIATDKIGNIYVVTDKDVRKLAKKVIGDKDSKNLLKYTSKSINLTSPKNNYANVIGINSLCKNGGKVILGKQTYTLSFVLEQKGDNSFSSIVVGKKDGDEWSYRLHPKDFKITKIEGDKSKYVCTFVVDGNTGEYIQTFVKFICEAYDKNMNSIITDIQLEEGSQATPYKPNRFEYVNIGEWKYSIKSNSIALDSENNIYISTNSNIQKLNSNGKKIDELSIQADNIALDLEGNMYISKDKSVEKLAKKMIRDKDRLNLLVGTTQPINILSPNGNTAYIVYLKNVSPNIDKVIVGKQTYTLSFILEQKGSNPFSSVVVGKKNGDRWGYRLFPKDFIISKIDSDKSKYVCTFVVDGGKGEYIRNDFCFVCESDNKNVNSIVTNVQLEEGNKATSYEPNFRDRSDGNLIRNGSFESNDLSDFATVNDCNVSISNEKAYRGKHSLKAVFKDVKNSASGYDIRYNWQSNKTYTLSGYIYSLKDITLRLRALFNGWETLGDKIIEMKANQWNYFTYTFTTKDTRGHILILLTDKTNYCDLHLDCVQLEIGDKATPWKPNFDDYIRQGEWKYIDSSKITNICVG